MGAPVAIPVTALTPLIPVGTDRSAAVEDPAATEEIVLADLTDVVVQREIVISGAGIGVGDGATFTNEITTADGEHLAELTGAVTIVHVRPGDHRIFGFYREFLTFADGTARTMGIVDITATMAGQGQSIDAYGLSGRYRGTAGSRSYLQTDKPDTFHAEIVLRAPAAKPQ
ncbi:hypothetical protein ACH4E7_35270 [Kitasatospora sp. NPDC018058]|uniref:allene oxide cyclase barrel-like domain-containing protein n=1 Tax=Kitasatospora sp. NPDC018058 TaxID=3364025 RepID=UPI0037C00C1E